MSTLGKPEGQQKETEDRNRGDMLAEKQTFKPKTLYEQYNIRFTP